MSKIPSDNIIELLQQTADSIEPRKEFSNELWRQMRSSPQNRSSFPFNFRLSPRLSGGMAFVILLTVAFILGPQKIVQAFQNLVGYLPGVGFVEDGDGTLYLAEPFVLTQDGATLTVEQAISDSNNLVVAFHIDGLPLREGGGFECMYNETSVVLPEGRSLHVMGGNASGKDTTFEARMEFQSLPTGVSDFQLKVGLSDNSQACTAPKQWLADLSLTDQKPQNVTLMPVYEEPTAEPRDLAQPQTDESSAEVEAQDETAAEEDFVLTLERTVLLDTGYRISGKMLYPQNRYENAICNFEDMRVSDANGKTIPIEAPYEGTNDNEWAVILSGRDFTAPLTIECQSVQVMKFLKDGPHFTFDSGSEPQVGQSWDVDEKMDVEGMKINIKKIEITAGQQDPENENGAALGSSSKKGVRIIYQADDAIQDVGFAPYPRPESSGWSAGGGKTDDGLHYIEMDLPPSGTTIGLQISDIFFNINGNWQVQWQLPESGE